MRNHFLFLYFSIFFSSYNCLCRDGINVVGMTGEYRNDVLFWHTYYRSLISSGSLPNLPKAAHMLKLNYDMELETEAQYFANRCHYEHDAIIKTKNYGIVGVNLHMQMDDKFDKRPEWAEIILDWWKEHDMYYYGREYPLQSQHFTQMIWAKTDKIGCGFIIFPLKHTNFTIYHKFYVCTYAPRGNMQNELPYIADKEKPKNT